MHQARRWMHKRPLLRRDRLLLLHLLHMIQLVVHALPVVLAVFELLEVLIVVLAAAMEQRDVVVHRLLQLQRRLLVRCEQRVRLGTLRLLEHRLRHRVVSIDRFFGEGEQEGSAGLGRHHVHENVVVAL